MDQLEDLCFSDNAGDHIGTGDGNAAFCLTLPEKIDIPEPDYIEAIGFYPMGVLESLLGQGKSTSR